MIRFMLVCCLGLTACKQSASSEITLTVKDFMEDKPTFENKTLPVGHATAFVEEDRILVTLFSAGYQGTRDCTDEMPNNDSKLQKDDVALELQYEGDDAAKVGRHEKARYMLAYAKPKTLEASIFGNGPRDDNTSILEITSVDAASVKGTYQLKEEGTLIRASFVAKNCTPAS